MQNLPQRVRCYQNNGLRRDEEDNPKERQQPDLQGGGDCGHAIANDAIPLPNVTSSALAKVIEYNKKHHEEDADVKNRESLKSWDIEFVKTVADMIKDKTPEEIRVIFNIENDFTPEEEKEIRKENKWAFE
ncbi:hypothetical protein CerSpe_212310 [Prunus speciosa]